MQHGVDSGHARVITIDAPVVIPAAVARCG
jgi:hypothetical protein